MKLIIPGELTDLNNFINSLKRNRWAGQKIKTDETNRVAWLTKAQRLSPVEKYPVKITYKWYMKDKRKDLDNTCFAKKFINDGLVVGGIIENDGQKQVSGFIDEFFIDKYNPRIEVEIEI